MRRLHAEAIHAINYVRDALRKRRPQLKARKRTASTEKQVLLSESAKSKEKFKSHKQNDLEGL